MLGEHDDTAEKKPLTEAERMKEQTRAEHNIRREKRRKHLAL